MAVKHEIKSQLAKLLATEDLIVENKKVETAQFDVHSRVLTLPIWEKASNNVYDSLVAHEVGHALYTPDRNWFKEIQIPPQFVNVVEDARIEKLMKRRYAGLAKTFYNGYNELHDQDFFQVNDEDISILNLADRANLYFKVGSFLPVAFSSTEKSIINLINDCETFDDTLSAAETLYNFCKQELERQKEEINDQEDGISLGEDTGMDSLGTDWDDYDTDSGDIANSNLENNDDYDCESSSNAGILGDDLDVKTASAFEDSIKDLVEQRDYRPNVYIELPKVNLKNIIIENKRIHDLLNESFSEQQLEWNDKEYVPSFGLYDEVDNKFGQFKKSAQREVNYLVKEFECKKSASAYARATTARTGVLDTAKLHTYRFNEDLFKKISVVPDGKNHGLVFVLDWSGSMAHVMLDTIKQLYNLLWFCKKVNIPFEVYAFTNEFPPSEGTLHQCAYSKKVGLAFIEETFSLMNLFTSKVKSKQLDEQMKNIFRLAYAFNHEPHYYNVPIGVGLSGTPLNEALICLHQILPQFKKENKIQKVQCVVLTDGEGAPLRYSKEFRRHWEDNPFMGSSYIHDRCIIRNRKTGYTYSCYGLGHWADVTDLIIKDLRQTFSDMNFIGIRILGSRDAGPFVRRYSGYEDGKYEKIMKVWKKEKAFSIKNSGYHSYFGLSSSNLGNDDEFEVDEDATKAQIKRAFTKSLKSKKMNKRILGEFMELVA
jgi:hypothetical protein